MPRSSYKRNEGVFGLFKYQTEKFFFIQTSLSLSSLICFLSLQTLKRPFSPTQFQMDDDGLNMRNWGYYEPPSFKEHLGLQLMSPIIDPRDVKPLSSSRENPFIMNPNGLSYHYPRNSMVPEPPVPMHYSRDGWIQRERILSMLPGNHNFSVIPDNSASQSMHMMQPVDCSKEMILDDYATGVGGGGGGGGDSGGSDGGQLKRTAAALTTPKQPRAKKPKKAPAPPLPKQIGNTSGQRSKSMKRSMDVVINGIDMDISGIPIPVCSCTGVPQQCYRWGCGGWQSACCTTTISMYPLPMSTKRRGARIAGRKMSQGAFKKVLEKLASEGYNFANAIDLRAHWAKHGTNKFVTIR
uniref:GAGA-binding transcriptional activator n=2 Tax=Helianthus annuus TaxID=4232 RepID=A0A251SBK0_HELAN